jgi:hypothetical protein
MKAMTMKLNVLHRKPWVTFFAGEVAFLLGSGLLGLSVFSENWAKEPSLLWILAALLGAVSVFLNVQAIQGLHLQERKKKALE